MGMFDYITCSYPLPGTPPEFAAGPGHQFQTKDLDCTLALYEITEAGRLIKRSTGAGEFGFNRDEEMPVDQDYAGTLDFYDSNIVASGPGRYTRNGEDAECVDYQATFVAGQLVEITELERSREPALPASHQSRGEVHAPPTKEEIATATAREAESLVGRRMHVLMGGLDDSDPGYPVEVVAEGPREICLRLLADAKYHREGSLLTFGRWQRDSTLFDSAEEAIAHRDGRKADWERRTREYEAGIAGRAAQ